MYDIILNFQDNFYQFFEWKQDDKIINYNKIPLLHISNKDIFSLKNNNVKLKKDFFNRIKETNKYQKKYICIVSDGKMAMALLFDDTGRLKKRSSLIFEEEEEAVKLTKKLKKTNINYENNNKKNFKNILIIEKEKKNIVMSYIKNSKDITTLKYLYYEYSEKELNNIDLLKNELLSELSKKWSENHKKIYNIVEIILKTT